MTRIRLTPAELMAGAQIGTWRHVMALLEKRKDCHGWKDRDGWGDHVEGACGEIAAAKALGRYWPMTVNTFKSGDDVAGFQVRCRSEHWHDLNIRDNDDPSKIFLLVTGKAPEFVVRGWALAREVMRPEFRAAHGGREEAWFVPQSALNALETLPGVGEDVSSATI